MAEPKWKLLIQGEANEELASLFSGRHEQDVRKALRLLIKEDDPRHPSDPERLDIAEVAHDAPGWYRLKLYEQRIRIVFRCIRKHNELMVEYRADEIPYEAPDQSNEVAVMHVGYRT